MDSFELKRKDYREALSKYLSENKIPIVDYTTEIDEDFILDVLEPKTEHALDLVIKAFDMYKTIHQSLQISFLDKDTNLAYALIDSFIKGQTDPSQYRIIEPALVKIFTTSQLKGQFEYDVEVLKQNESSFTEFSLRVFELISKGDDFEETIEKIIRNFIRLTQKIAKGIASTNSFFELKLEHEKKLKGMEKYLSEHSDILLYIHETLQPINSNDGPILTMKEKK